MNQLQVRLSGDLVIIIMVYSTDAYISISLLLFIIFPGLNSAAAAILMVELRRLAKTEKMIILYTVRQPSTKVYNTFDKMLILSKGQQIYFGKMKSAKSHFAKLGYPCPLATNPAEHFLDLADPEFADEEAFKIFVGSWLKSKTKADLEASAALAGRSPSDDKQDKRSNGISTSFAREIGILFR
jgi:ABC-type multidrug transport system ATPase subunit